MDWNLPKKEEVKAEEPTPTSEGIGAPTESVGEAESTGASQVEPPTAPEPETVESSVAGEAATS